MPGDPIPAQDTPLIRRGALGCSAILLVLVALVGGVVAGRALGRPGIDVHVHVTGADAARAGARSILVQGTFGTYRQTCGTTCNDVDYTFKDKEGVFRVQVRDAAGACVFCDQVYITSSMTFWADVSGRDKLAMKVTTQSGH